MNSVPMRYYTIHTSGTDTWYGVSKNTGALSLMSVVRTIIGIVLFLLVDLTTHVT